jgi:hypothetical protein
VIPILLFMLSAGALGQFALYYWRGVLAGMAAQPLSERMRKAALICDEGMAPADFSTMMNLQGLTPSLRESNGGFRAVQVYYRALKVLSGLPQAADWANREMKMCARYAAVVLDQRLTANLQCAAEIRSI